MRNLELNLLQSLNKVLRILKRKLFTNFVKLNKRLKKKKKLKYIFDIN
jgi:hypothetical protein